MDGYAAALAGQNMSLVWRALRARWMTRDRWIGHASTTSSTQNTTHTPSRISFR